MSNKLSYELINYDLDFQQPVSSFSFPSPNISKQLSESVAQIMSQKMFRKTPSNKIFNKPIWTVERYIQSSVLKQIFKQQFILNH